MINLIRSVRGTIKRKVLVLVVIVLTLIIILVFASVLVSHNQSIGTPSKNISSFPAIINDTNGQELQLDWQVLSEEEEGVESTTFWTNESLPTSASPVIFRTISTYFSSIEALINYKQKISQNDLSNKWPNFYHPDSRYIREANLFDLLEENYVVCEMGGESLCQRWVYIGRLGRYTVEVTYMGANRGINTEVFAGIVKGIIEDLRK